MANASSCPNVEDLERFLLGQMAGDDADRVERHLARCGACLETMHALGGEDTLVQAMRRAPAAAVPEPPEGVLEGLMARLSSWHRTDAEPGRSSPDRTGEAAAFLAPPQEPGAIGRLGPYHVLKVLGSGGMGVVYQARQERPQRLVALKMILAGPRADRERLARFRGETEVIARLHHPNIVQVYEVGEHDGHPYYAMEFLEGGSLAQKLAAAPLAVGAAAELVEALARAVQHAHERGVIHRDLKSANVLLTADGTPKVVDFGLAKLWEAPPDAPPPAFQTESGAILGTPGYMAPEQALGRGKEIGPAADVYALGAILYEALTGRPPFQGATVLETLEQVRSQEPVAPSRLRLGLPRDLQTICLKCLAKEPARRYASAQALADDLARFQRGEPIRARPVSAWERARKWARRRPALAALLVVSLAAALSLAAGGVWHNARLQEEVHRRQQQQERAAANLQTAIDLLEAQLDEVFNASLGGGPPPEPFRGNLLNQAARFYEKLLAENNHADPDHADPLLRRALGRGHSGLGWCNWLRGNYQPVEADYRRAVALQDQLLAESPQDVDYRTDLAITLRRLSEHQGRLGQTAEAQRNHERMISLVESLPPQHPRLAWLCSYVATKLGHEGRFREALPWIDQQIVVIEALERQAQPDASQEVRQTVRQLRRTNLHTLYVTRALCLGQLGEHQQALATWDRALALGEVPGAVLSPAFCQVMRAWNLAHLGDYRQATQEVDRAVGPGVQEGEVLYRAAAVYARSAAAPSDRPEADAARAVDLLRRAHAAGQFNQAGSREELTTDKDFDSLRARTDFRNLLAEIEAGGPRQAD